MKRVLLWSIALSLVGAGVLWFVLTRAGRSDTILEMSRRGESEAEMLKAVAERHPFRLTAADVIELKAAQVPDSVIVEMLRDASPSTAVVNK